MKGENENAGSPRRVGPEFSSIRRRRRTPSRGVWIAAVVVVALAGAGIGYYFWAQGPEAEPAPEPRQALEADDPVVDREDEGDEEEDPSEERVAEEEEEEADRPSLDASDAFIRNLAVGLSQNPRLAAWLTPDGLARRFVGAVVSVAHGASPVDHVEHVEPDGRFRVVDQGDRFIIDPASYERYDGIAETFGSLDAEGSARLFRELSPLFEEAYAELGLPDDSFRDVFARALGQLLAPAPPGTPVEVEPFDAGYEYRDPELADLSEAQKHLLRMGPENMRTVQAKLRSISEELAIEPEYP